MGQGNFDSGDEDYEDIVQRRVSPQDVLAAQRGANAAAAQKAAGASDVPEAVQPKSAVEELRVEGPKRGDTPEDFWARQNEAVARGVLPTARPADANEAGRQQREAETGLRQKQAELDAETRARQQQARAREAEAAAAARGGAAQARADAAAKAKAARGALQNFKRAGGLTEYDEAGNEVPKMQPHPYPQQGPTPTGEPLQTPDVPAFTPGPTGEPPVQDKAGNWVVPHRNEYGGVDAMPVERSPHFHEDQTTGERYYTHKGQKIPLGANANLVERNKLKATQVELERDNMQERIDLGDARLRAAEAKEGMKPFAAQVKTAETQIANLEKTLAVAKGKGRELVEKRLAEARAVLADPNYLAAKAKLDAAEAEIGTRQKSILDRREQALEVVRNLDKLKAARNLPPGTVLRPAKAEELFPPEALTTDAGGRRSVSRDAVEAQVAALVAQGRGPEMQGPPAPGARVPEKVPTSHIAGYGAYLEQLRASGIEAVGGKPIAQEIEQANEQQKKLRAMGIIAEKVSESGAVSMAKFSALPDAERAAFLQGLPAAQRAPFAKTLATFRAMAVMEAVGLQNADQAFAMLSPEQKALVKEQIGREGMQQLGQLAQMRAQRESDQARVEGKAAAYEASGIGGKVWANAVALYGGATKGLGALVTAPPRIYGMLFQNGAIKDRAGIQWADNVDAILDETYSGGKSTEIADMAGNLIGSTLSFLIPTGLVGQGLRAGGVGAKAAQGAALATTALAGSVINGAGSVAESTALGLTDEETWKRFLLAAPLGASEALGLPRGMQRMVNGMIQLDRATQGSFKRLLVSMGREGLQQVPEEVLQEAGNALVIGLGDMAMGIRSRVDERTGERRVPTVADVLTQTVESGLQGAAGALMFGAVFAANAHEKDRARLRDYARALETDGGYAVMHDLLGELRGQMNTARAEGREDEVHALKDRIEQAQFALGEAAKKVTKIEPTAREAMARTIAPEFDLAGADRQLDGNETLRFAAVEIGRAMRGAYPGAAASGQGGAQAALDQMLGVHVVATDLTGVLNGGMIEAGKAAALERLGLLETEQQADGSTVMRVTDDALALFPPALRDAVANDTTGKYNFKVTAGTPGQLVNNLVKSGEDRLAAEARAKSAQAGPASSPGSAAAPATGGTIPAAEGAGQGQTSGGSAPQFRVRLKVELPGGVARTQPVTVSAANAAEAVQIAVAQARGSAPQGAKIAVAGKVEAVTGEVTGVTANVTGSRGDVTDDAAEVNRARQVFARTYDAARPLLLKLGVGKVVEDRTMSGGMAVDKGVLRFNPDQLAMMIRLKRDAGMSEEDAVALVMDEEKWHAVGLTVINQREAEEIVRTAPKRMIKAARKIYNGWDNLNAWQQGHELVRMVLQGRYAGTLTEQIHKAIEKIAAWFKKRAEELPDDAPLIRAAARIEARLAEISADERMDIDSTNDSPTDEDFSQDSGAEFQISTPQGGVKVRGRWRVVEASELTTSDRPQYNAELQRRDRGRSASQAQVAEIAFALDPTRLGESATSDTGAPIINARGEVLSGNGRTMALRQVYERGATKAAEYRAFVEQMADKLGIADQLAGMRNPVLVREVTDFGKSNETEFADLSNRSQLLGRSAVETAMDDGRMLVDEGLLDQFQPGEDGDVFTAGNRQFNRLFVQHTADRAQLLKGDGSFAPELEGRIRRAVLAAIMANAPESAEAVTSALERADKLGLTRQVTGIMAAAGRLLKLRTTNPEMDIAAPLAEALAGAIEAKGLIESGKAKGIEDALGQGVLFGEPSEAAKILTRELLERTSAKAVREMLGEYARVAESVASGPTMFGDETPGMTPAEVLENIVNAGAREKARANAARGLREALGAAAVVDTYAPRYEQIDAKKPWLKPVTAAMRALPVPVQTAILQANDAGKLPAVPAELAPLISNANAAYEANLKREMAGLKPAWEAYRKEFTKEVTDWYDREVSAVAEDTGTLPMVGVALKGDRGMEKALADARLNGTEPDVTTINDVVRGSIVALNDAGVQAAVAAIQARFEIVKHKDRFATPLDGYSDHAFTIRLPNGRKAEIQVHRVDLLFAKEVGVGHGIYEGLRSAWAAYGVTKNAALEPWIAAQQQANADFYGSVVAAFLNSSSVPTSASPISALATPAAAMPSTAEPSGLRNPGDPGIRASIRPESSFRNSVPRGNLSGSFSSLISTQIIQGEEGSVNAGPLFAAKVEPKKLRELFDAAADEPGPMDIAGGLDVAGYPGLFGGGLGVSRADMPQLPKEFRARFLAWLEKRGIGHSDKTVSALRLKATQRELDAVRIGRVLRSERELSRGFVSADGYVIDGHHRWAAQIAEGFTTGRMGMDVTEIGLPIRGALAAMRAFNAEHGIVPKPIEGEMSPVLGASRVKDTGTMDLFATPAVQTAATAYVKAAAKSNVVSKKDFVFKAKADGLGEVAEDLFSFAVKNPPALTVSSDAGKSQQPYENPPTAHGRPSSESAPSGALDDLFGIMAGKREAERGAGAAGGAEGGAAAGSGQSDVGSDGVSADGLPEPGGATAAGERGGGVEAGSAELGGRGGRGGTGPGTGQSADAGRDGTDRGTGPAVADRLPPLVERTTDPDARNHVIERGAEIAPRGLITKLKANIKAVKLLKAIQSARRNATAEEKAALVQFTGWGALSQAFDQTKADYIAGGHLDRDRKDLARYQQMQKADMDAGRTGDYYKELVERSEGTIRGYEGWEKKWSGYYAQIKEALTEPEWRRARASTINAHYTSGGMVSLMWDAATRLGFRGGNVGEMATGIGHFFGLMPQSLQDRSKLFGVEMDPVSAGIAQLLYPEADIQNAAFQQADVADNSLDLNIGNVPFANIAITDAAIKALDGPLDNLHDYYFAKMLQKTRPGGLIVAITSAFTMDKMTATNRKWLATRADLVGAFRLPNTAFKENAGTDVVTDIIILRKKDGNAFEHGKDWTMLAESRTAKGVPIRVNEYFAAHPQNVLGLLADDGEMFAGRDGETKEMTVHPDPTRPADVALAQAIDALPADIVGAAAGTSVRGGAASGVKMGNIVRGKDGNFYFNTGGEPTAMMTESDAELNKPANRPRVLGFMGVRDALNRQYELELSPTASAEAIEENREELNRLYDNYTRRFENFHHRSNKALLIDDPDYFRLAGAEVEQRAKGGIKALVAMVRGKAAKVYVKADVFSKRVLSPRVEPTSADSIEDAMGMSLGWRGRVDTGYIAQLTGQTREQVEAALLEREIVLRDPDTGQIQSREQYLSGNVRKKLEIARAAGGAFARNVKLLEAAQPADVGIADIKFSVGATWIPAAIYRQFMQSLGLDVTVNYTTVGGGADHWTVENPTRVSADSVRYKDFDAGRFTADAMLDALLNMRRIEIRDSARDGGKVNPEATALAVNKANEFKAEFERWARDTPGVADELAATYNREVNGFALRTYDGQHLTFPWASNDFNIFPDKKNTVWRAIQEGFGLIAHGVGGGKTIVGSAIALELRRLGLARKPMIVVHNATLEQFADTIAQIAPASRVLVGRKDELKGAKRKEFLMRIAAGDWDAVVVAHSTFNLIADDPAFMQKQMEGLVDELTEALMGAGYNDLGAAKDDRKKNASVKQMVRMLEQLEAKIAEASKRTADTELLSFQQLGVDALIVDEVHKFKKLPFATKLDVKGIDGGMSKSGYGLLMRARGIQEKAGGKNVFTMTGTPVTNTLGEVWNQVRLVAPHLLKEYGIEKFDQFVSKFATVESKSEADPSGARKMVERLAKIINLPEWATFFRMAADVKFGDDMVTAGRPDVKGGKAELVAVERTQGATAWVNYIRAVLAAVPAARSEAMRDKDWERVNRIGAIPVTAYQASRAAAIDIRLVEPRAKDEPGSKVNLMIERAMGIYKATDSYQGTQVIFADAMNPTRISLFDQVMPLNNLAIELDPLKEPGTTFHLYDDIRMKLIARGVPEAQIAVLTDKKFQGDSGEVAKKKLWEKVNAGEVRFVMGSTEKLGTGVNMQRLMAAAHHLDVPWTPAGLEQRDGRVLRQGNLHMDMKIPIELIRYGMKDTLDEALWGILERKQRFIVSALSGKLNGREIEEDEMTLNLGQQMAILSGPYGQEMFETDNRIRELEYSRQAHASSVRRRDEEIADAKKQVRSLEMERTGNEPKWAKLDRLAAAVQKDGALLTVDGEAFETKKAMLEAVNAEIQTARQEFEKRAELDKKAVPPTLTSIVANGVPLRLEGRPYTQTIYGEEQQAVGEKVTMDFLLEGQRWNGRFTDENHFGEVKSAATLVSRLEELGERVQGRRDSLRRNLDRYTALANMERLGAWAHQEEFDRKTARAAELLGLMRGAAAAAAPTATTDEAEPQAPREGESDEDWAQRNAAWQAAQASTAESDADMVLGAARVGEEERIASVAVKRADGKVFTGNGTHWDVYDDAFAGDPAYESNNWELPPGTVDGFTTTNGRFLDREDAYSLAQKYLDLPSDGAYAKIGGLESEEFYHSETEAGLMRGQSLGASQVTDSGRAEMRVKDERRMANDALQPAKSVAELVKENMGLAVTIANAYRNIPGHDWDNVLGEARKALVKAARGFDADRGGAPFGAYAGTAIRNTLNNLFNKNARTAAREVASADEEGENEGEGESLKNRLVDEGARARVSGGIEGRETSAELAEAMAGLPDRVRTVLTMHGEGAGLREIGTAIGLSHEMARRILANGTKAVEARLRERGFKGVDEDGVLYAAKVDKLEGVEFYRSGATTDALLDAYQNTGSNIGVDVQTLGKSHEEKLTRYAKRGGKVFVDSGAFGVRQRGGAVDFEFVFARYEKMLGAAGDGAANFSLVMPDVIGDQAGTLSLVRRYADRIRMIARRGARLIVPAQTAGGSLDLAELAQKYADILKIPFALGIPSKMDATPRADVVAFFAEAKPNDVHLLGIGVNAATQPYLEALRANSPGTNLTMDATWHRAKVGQGRPITEVRNQLFKDAADDTEMAASIYVDGWVPTDEEADVILSVYGGTALGVRQAALKGELGEYLAGLDYGDPYGSKLKELTNRITQRESGPDLTRRAIEQVVTMLGAAAVHDAEIGEEADRIENPPAEAETRPQEFLKELVVRTTAGRLDALDYVVPGTKNLLTDAHIKNARISAALRIFRERIEENVRQSFGYPSWWRNAGNAARLKRFTAELLPTAARLNAVGQKADGAFEFASFWMRAGEIGVKLGGNGKPETDAKRMGMNGVPVTLREGVFIPGRHGEKLRVGKMVDTMTAGRRRVFWQLERFVPAAEQATLHEAFHQRYPEAAHWLDSWINPHLKEARVEIGGIELPDFNRFSLREFWGEISPFGEVGEVKGYTPDIFQTKSLVGMLAGRVRDLLNRTWTGPGREYKSGEARERGQVRNLFEGFNARAAEAHMETERRKLAEALLKKALVPIPEGGVPSNFVRWDEETVDQLLRSYHAVQGLDPAQYVALKRKVLEEARGGGTVPADAELGLAFDAADRARIEKLAGRIAVEAAEHRDKMIHRTALAELRRPLASQYINNGLLRMIDAGLRGATGGYLANPFTLAMNQVSNEVFVTMHTLRRALYGVMSLPFDRKQGKLGLYEAGNLLKGVITDRWYNKRVRELVPDELFDGNNRFNSISTEDFEKSPMELLRELNVAGAVLKGMRYGNVDARAKQRIAFASYMAHARLAWDEAKAAGKVGEGVSKGEWMKDWVQNLAPDAVHRSAYYAAMLVALDYVNVAPALDETNQVMMGGRDVTAEVNMLRRGITPFAKFPYNLARQGKRFTFDSLRDLLPGNAQVSGIELTRGGETTWAQKRQAVANLTMMGMMYLLARAMMDDDDDGTPKLGRELDDLGRRLEGAYQTSGRINITDTPIGRTISAALDMMGLHDLADADAWMRIRALPYASSAVALATMEQAVKGNPAGQEMEANATAVLSDMVSEGLLLKMVNALRDAKGPYDKGKNTSFMAGETGFDLVTGRFIPPPLLRTVGALVDPISRRSRPVASLDYDPGLLTAIKMKLPGAAKDLPPSGRVVIGADGSEKSEAAVAELLARELPEGSFRHYVDAKGKAKVAYVMPDKVNVRPRVLELFRAFGMNVKFLDRDEYAREVAALE